MAGWHGRAGSREGRSVLHRHLVGQRLLALSILGWMLFNYPLLALFEGTEDWLGFPATYVYLFSAWGLLILLMGWIAEDRRHQPPGAGTARRATPPGDGN